MAFSGVRSSWLMTARKSAFARFAPSASARAASASPRARSLSPTSSAGEKRTSKSLTRRPAISGYAVKVDSRYRWENTFPVWRRYFA